MAKKYDINRITKRLFRKKYIRYGLFLIGGLFLGWLIFHSPKETAEKHRHEETTEAATTWTCSMHPHIRMPEPGDCPICGMDLIPLDQKGSVADAAAVEMTDEAVKLAEIQTSIVSRTKPIKEIRLYGKIRADERLVQTQPAHVPGRIEKLLVNFTGEEVRQGQPIAQIYSPSLVTVQEELREAYKIKDTHPQILEAVREKLRFWKFTDEQIEKIEKSGEVSSVFNVYATVSGIVISKTVNVGEYVQQGSPLYQIADLSKVWAMFDAYESDLPWIRKGDPVTFTLQSIPGKEFTGTVSYIDPVIDPETRVARVRVELKNGNHQLKPEMFATGIIMSELQGPADNLVIPQSAVLWTGTRSVVYVKLNGADKPAFRMREITLGPSLSNSYVVLKGLMEGEEIVTNGAFSIDAAAQLAGKPSMMNSESSEAHVPHVHEDINANHVRKPPESNSQIKVDKAEQKAGAGLEDASFLVSGNCEMCKERIEAAALSVPGVINSEWDLETKMIHVNFNKEKTSIDEIHKAIALAGHDTEKAKAPQEVYDELPDCCRYTRN